jgi:hypothetical protein
LAPFAASTLGAAAATVLMSSAAYRIRLSRATVFDGGLCVGAKRSAASASGDYFKIAYALGAIKRFFYETAAPSSSANKKRPSISGCSAGAANNNFKFCSSS